MLFPNTIKLSSGEILTGRLWRKDHTLFSQLPFYSDIVRMDEIGEPLQVALSQSRSEEWYRGILIVSDVPIISLF
jgi:hypothetical protein